MNSARGTDKKRRRQKRRQADVIQTELKAPKLALFRFVPTNRVLETRPTLYSSFLLLRPSEQIVSNPFQKKHIALIKTPSHTSYLMEGNIEFALALEVQF